MSRAPRERWVRNVVIRGEIEASEYAMIFLRDITKEEKLHRKGVKIV